MRSIAPPISEHWLSPQIQFIRVPANQAHPPRVISAALPSLRLFERVKLARRPPPGARDAVAGMGAVDENGRTQQCRSRPGSSSLRPRLVFILAGRRLTPGLHKKTTAALTTSVPASSSLGGASASVLWLRTVRYWVSCTLAGFIKFRTTPWSKIRHSADAISTHPGASASDAMWPKI